MPAMASAVVLAALPQKAAAGPENRHKGNVVPRTMLWTYHCCNRASELYLWSMLGGYGDRTGTPPTGAPGAEACP